MRKNTFAGLFTSVYFVIAFGLILTLALTLFFCVTSLFIGLSVSWWQFPLAGLSALAVSYFVVRSFAPTGTGKAFIGASLTVILLTVFSILTAGYFYDISFDGQWYHQETIIRLKEGYNPEYQRIAIPIDEKLINNTNDWCQSEATGAQAEDAGKPVVNIKYLQINHFSKNNEITAAAIYAFTGRVETGKAINLMLLLASFFLCLSLFYRLEKIKKPVCWLLAFILAFNPVTSNEIFTFCVDGFAGSAILCLFALFGLILTGYSRWCLVLLVAVICIAVNIKFTLVAYTVIFATGFMLILALQKKWQLAKKVFITSLIAGVFGVLYLGFNPYVINLVHDHNIFYGIPQVEGEIFRLTPDALRGHNRLEQLAMSLASHQGWADSSKRTFIDIAKVPFHVNRHDILEANDIEQQLSGFGPFFSGELIVAIIVLIITAIHFGKTEAFRLCALVLLIISVSVLIMPSAWWMRFVPQLWFFPAAILLLLYFITFRASRVLKTIISLSMGLNVVWGLLIVLACLFNTARINYQLAQLKALNKPVYVKYCNYRDFNSNRARFSEAGIILSPTSIPADSDYAVPCSTTRIETPDPLPNIPETFLMQLRAKALGIKKMTAPKK